MIKGLKWTTNHVHEKKLPHAILTWWVGMSHFIFYFFYRWDKWDDSFLSPCINMYDNQPLTSPLRKAFVNGIYYQRPAKVRNYTYWESQFMLYIRTRLQLIAQQPLLLLYLYIHLLAVYIKPQLSAYLTISTFITVLQVWLVGWLIEEGGYWLQDLKYLPW